MGSPDTGAVLHAPPAAFHMFVSACRVSPRAVSRGCPCRCGRALRRWGAHLSRTASSCPSQSPPALPWVVLGVTGVRPWDQGPSQARCGGRVLAGAVCWEINPVPAIDRRWEAALPLAGR